MKPVAWRIDSPLGHRITDDEDDNPANAAYHADDCALTPLVSAHAVLTAIRDARRTATDASAALDTLDTLESELREVVAL